jgi:uncharacterized protein involved in exopolysaccharide biosynthesis
VTNKTEGHRGGSSAFETALEIWSRRKWVALAVFASILAATTSLTVSLPDLYRATATVLVETQQISETLVQPAVAAELETRIQTIRQEVMSRTRLQNLITQFDLYPSLRKKGVPFDAIIAFEIGYAGGDPQVVAGVANALASFYVSENTKIREGQAVRTAEFLKAQLADAKSVMDAHERACQ